MVVAIEKENGVCACQDLALSFRSPIRVHRHLSWSLDSGNPDFVEEGTISRRRDHDRDIALRHTREVNGRRRQLAGLP